MTRTEALQNLYNYHRQVVDILQDSLIGDTHFNIVARALEDNDISICPSQICIEQDKNKEPVISISRFLQRVEYEHLLLQSDLYFDSTNDLTKDIILRSGNITATITLYALLPLEEKQLLQDLGILTSTVFTSTNLQCHH